MLCFHLCAVDAPLLRFAYTYDLFQGLLFYWADMSFLKRRRMGPRLIMRLLRHPHSCSSQRRLGIPPFASSKRRT